MPWDLIYLGSIIGSIAVVYYLQRPIIAATETVSDGDRHYKIRVSENKNTRKVIEIPVEIQGIGDFILRRERWYEYPFRALRISHECQVGEDSFDSNIYILSDDKGFCRFLTGNRQLRNLVLELQKITRDEDVTFHQLKCNGLELNAIYRKWSLFKLKELPLRLARQVVPILEQIATLLRGYSWPEGQNDKGVERMRRLNALSFGVGGAGLIQLVFASEPHNLVVYEHDALFHDAIAIGIGLTLLLLLLGMSYLGKSARRHDYLLRMVTVGCFGLVVGSQSFLTHFNIHNDESVAIEYQQPLQSKHMKNHHRRRGGDYKTYHVMFPSWVDKYDWQEVQVSKQFYDQARQGDKFRISVYPGYFGYIWYRFEGLVKADNS